MREKEDEILTDGLMQTFAFMNKLRWQPAMVGDIQLGYVRAGIVLCNSMQTFALNIWSIIDAVRFVKGFADSATHVN